MDFFSTEIKSFIAQALNEDIGPGDYSSLAAIPQNTQGKAKLIIKENGILAGVNLALSIFDSVDKNLKIEVLINDGTAVKYGDIGLLVEGSVHSILKSERLVLNLLQHLSGVASATNKIVELVKGTNVKILDTRKTTPLLRGLEKWAVTMGGGFNHRFGLYDMVMLKDNHVDFAGGIESAIKTTKKYLADNHLDLKIEIETRTLKEVEEVLRVGGVDRIMLDNFSPELMREAVILIDKKFETEASGGITLESVRSFAETGVDYISIGAITHSVKAMDISLKSYS